MPAIEFPKGLTETENLPKTKRTLINCFNNGQGQVISRPGISSIATTGRVARGQFVWNGSLYQIQSEELHKITNVTTGASTNLGTIAGSEPVFTAIGFNTATLVVKGGKLYTLDTSDTLIDISGNANFVPCDSLAHINGRFVYIPSNGDPAFFSDVGAAGTVQALSFFDAEELPDKNNNVFNFKNTLYIMGTDSIELFRDTGASPNPFGRISGARLTTGFIGGLLEYNETFLFIGREKDQSAGIYALGSGVAPKISNSAIDLILAGFTEAQMARATTGRFKWRGYDIAYFTILTTSFAFFGGNWFELTTLVDSVPGVWQGGFITQFEETYFTADKGNIGKLAKVNNDYGNRIERIIELGFQDSNNDRFTCQSIELAVSQGFNVASAAEIAAAMAFDIPFFDCVLLSSFTNTITKVLRNDGKEVKQNRIHVTIKDLTFTGTITGTRLQLTDDGGVTWKTGANDYRYAEVDQSGFVNPVDVDGLKILTNTVPTHASFELHGMSLLVPTMFRASDMTISTTIVKQISGVRKAAEANNGFRVIFDGTSVDITGGTMYVGYWD